MLRLAIAATLMLVPLAAGAQAGNPPAAEPAGTVAPLNPIRNHERPASVAPPADEEGWTVIQLRNGYIRYQTEPGETNEEAEEPEGTLSVVRAPTAHPAQNSQVMEPPPPPEEEGAFEGPSTMPPSSCREEYDLLAQRLLYLRGIDIDPVTAGMVLPQVEVPYSPILFRPELALGSSYLGGSLLTSFITFDTDTRRLAQDLAQCLER